MTDPGQLGQASDDSSEPAQEAHELSEDTRQQPAGRFSLPRSKRAWLGIALSLIALAGCNDPMFHQDRPGNTDYLVSAGLATS